MIPEMARQLDQSDRRVYRSMAGKSQLAKLLSLGIRIAFKASY